MTPTNLRHIGLILIGIVIFSLGVGGCVEKHGFMPDGGNLPRDFNTLPPSVQIEYLQVKEAKATELIAIKKSCFAEPIIYIPLVIGGLAWAILTFVFFCKHMADADTQ